MLSTVARAVPIPMGDKSVRSMSCAWIMSEQLCTDRPAKSIATIASAFTAEVRHGLTAAWGPRARQIGPRIAAGHVAEAGAMGRVQ